MEKLVKAGVLLICLSLLSNVAAFAETADMADPQAARRAEFQKIDRDSSIFVTREEMEAYCDERFNEADKDGNGILDDNEIKADNTGAFATADQNSDGKVTREEARARYKQYFDEMDTNQDQQISPDEYANSGKISVKF
jgi:hypothetical protein